jgi:hypothetical protein
MMRIATLRFAPKPFNAVMQKIYETMAMTGQKAAMAVE